KLERSAESPKCGCTLPALSCRSGGGPKNLHQRCPLIPEKASAARAAGLGQKLGVAIRKKLWLCGRTQTVAREGAFRGTSARGCHNQPAQPGRSCSIYCAMRE